jgi:DNA-entry nuclease
MKKRGMCLIAFLLTVCLLFSACGSETSSQPYENTSNLSSISSTQSETNNETESSETQDNDVSSETESSRQETQKSTTSTIGKPSVSLSNIPAYSGKAFVALNNNEPFFSSSELTTKSFEQYSNLDSLGRCGVVMACVGKDIMPTEERGSIGQVKPTGWHTVKYDCVDGKYLYNRCHLIGYQLTGENANTKNLITGTRYMNVEGMLPFENMVSDFVKETGYHVMYRVTPIFEGNNLLVNGVQMEAYSVEDDGDGICFNVFVYNIQPQIAINYANGDSSYIGGGSNDVEDVPNNNTDTSASYILNKNTKKFHYPTCSSVDRMKESNKEYYTGSREELINRGYNPCGNCHP